MSNKRAQTRRANRAITKLHSHLKSISLGGQIPFIRSWNRARDSKQVLLMGILQGKANKRQAATDKCSELEDEMYEQGMPFKPLIPKPRHEVRRRTLKRSARFSVNGKRVA